MLVNTGVIPSPVMSVNVMPKTPSAFNPINNGPSRWVASIKVWPGTQSPPIYKIWLCNRMKNEFQI